MPRKEKLINILRVIKQCVYTLNKLFLFSENLKYLFATVY